MSRSKAIFALLLVCLATWGPTCPGGPPVKVLPPPSYAIAGLTFADWPIDASELAAFATVAAPGATPADVVVRSGLATQAAWFDSAVPGISPPAPGLAIHPRLYSNAPLADAATLLGAPFSIAYAGGGSGGLRLKNAADSHASGGGQLRAQIGLEWAVSYGHPVMVHLDLYYVFDEVSAQEPFYLAAGKSHTSRFVVVHAYDETNVYFADMGPRALLGASRDNVTVTWPAFLAAWKAAASLHGLAKMGPYFALTASDKPSAAPAPPEWTFAYLALDAAAVPESIRSAAAAIRNGADPSSVLASAGLFADARALMHTFADAAGDADIAASYESSSALWHSLVGVSDPTTAADTLDEIADLEESGLAKMLTYAATAASIIQLMPVDAANLLPDFPAQMFRWAALPGVTRHVLQFALAGDFSDPLHSSAFTARFGSSHFEMTGHEWFRTIPKDDGDRSLLWRVAGKDASNFVHSPDRTLTWDLLKITTTSPVDGYILSPGLSPQLVWTGPSFVRRPRLAVSMNGDFSDPSQVLYYNCPLPPKLTYAPFSLYHTLKARDPDDTSFWRIEDAAGSITHITPSEPRTFIRAPSP